ncbi:hypothetical protein SAMN02746065_10695 [Desulfocicer vacuolatum DSM 3385]|uniref:Transposase n=1 Tax=Desulfocicer vacuolatum DSM 3385 TaxID=1121400 RepID=A0A1W2AVP9_9BACT|nr:hypothetical protein [Desulfocicer vacuolatum]SMC64562.1 hypothetical protein SAMN02746065_10695 [Desulfocicer vacuolatum DSM 3385]
MAVKIPKIDEIPIEEQSPLVLTLLESLNALAEENKALRDEIAILKGEKAKPKIKPSSLEGRRKTKPDSSKNAQVQPNALKPKLLRYIKPSRFLL